MSKLAELQKKLSANISKASQAATLHTQDVMSDMGGFEQYGAKRLESIELWMVSPNPHQPRIAFNEEALQQLANNIKELGLLQPITVRKAGFNRYEIISGERRYRACEMLGMNVIDCLVVNISDEDNALLALAENITRDDLEDYEIAKAISSFKKSFPNKKEYAEILNIGRSKLYRLLSYEILPKSILDRLNDKPSLMPDYAAQQIKTLVNEGYSIPQLEPYIHDALNLVESGELKHSKIISFINTKLEEKSAKKTLVSKTNKRQLLREDGSAFGSIKQDGKNLTIQIKTNEISDENKQKLEDFLKTLV